MVFIVYVIYSIGLYAKDTLEGATSRINVIWNTSWYESELLVPLIDVFFRMLPCPAATVKAGATSRDWGDTSIPIFPLCQSTDHSIKRVPKILILVCLFLWQRKETAYAQTWILSFKCFQHSYYTIKSVWFTLLLLPTWNTCGLG